MGDLRYRPKSDYLKTATWQELYRLTEHWKNDMGFYGDELRFFHNVVDKYFMWMIADIHIELVQTMVKHIDKLDIEHDRLNKSIQRHFEHIESLFGKDSSHDEQRFRNEHETLESEIEGFVNEFRKTKKEVFAMTEKVIQEEKLKHLLSS